MRRWESREKSSARRCSAACGYAELSSRMAPRIARSASMLAGIPRSRIRSVVAIQKSQTLGSQHSKLERYRQQNGETPEKRGLSLAKAASHLFWFVSGHGL